MEKEELFLAPGFQLINVEIMAPEDHHCANTTVIAVSGKMLQSWPKLVAERIMKNRVFA